ncbi:MAG: T9SS type A sorting domain-containing protein [Candidatus Latescibacteria bacterium]|nr:T9SS type A sorting domain-containing protein [Candidatus Latescibacterota bacterium]
MKNNSIIISKLLTVLVFAVLLALPGDDIPAAENAGDNTGTAMKSSAAGRTNIDNDDYGHGKLNPVHMVVVFTRFKGEAPGDTLAPSWAKELFTGEEGSIPHFFDKVSFGKYKVSGEFLPKRYEMPKDSTSYIMDRDSYARDLLTLLDEDPTVDFSDYDNDGPDGIPGSSDDDNWVDYLVMMPMSRPFNFFFNYATGIWTLGLKETFFSRYNKSSDGKWIRLDRFSGCLATANSLKLATGTIVAELSHVYGAEDLMDKRWDDPASDGAGVGYWDFLGRGVMGWKEQGGPVGPCSFNRWKMESIGLNNSNLVDLYGLHEGVSMRDVSKEDGKTYKINISDSEYFLMEYRRNDGLYYDRLLPRNGIFIWHVLRGETNGDELKKLCDLECPDGRYTDAGYPLGQMPDPIKGGDNLDFWAHDIVYTLTHKGNAGDEFDVFDGFHYNRFDSETNPNTFSKVTLKTTNIEIYNIRAVGDSMVFDCSVPPFYDWYSEKYPFIGVGYHRFSSTGVESSTKPANKELFLLKYDYDYKPDALVTINGDLLSVESLALLENFEIESMVAKRLLTDDKLLRNSLITRRNISPEDFGKIVKGYGVQLSDLGSGEGPRAIQMVSRISGSQIKPITINLHQNFPNPFNSMTTISYVLPSNGPIVLEIYNIIGQKVLQFDQGFKPAGKHEIYMDANDLASGVYLYRLKGRNVSTTKKFTLLR